MRFTRLLLAATLLAAPANAAPRDPDAALRAYVIGRYAEIDNEVELASRLMTQARSADPNAATLTRRAWELAVAAGDGPRAFQLARTLAAAGDQSIDVTLTRLTEAAIRRDWVAVAALRPKISGQGWPLVAGPVLDGWLAAQRGDAATALAGLDPQRQPAYLRPYLVEARAHLLASLARWDEAATAYRQARAAGGPAPMFMRLGQADALAMAGRPADALAVLSAGDPMSQAARERLAAGRRVGPLVAEPRQALAWLFVRLAADLQRERADALALMFARLASFAAPEQPLAWLSVAEYLGRQGQASAALAALAKVPAGQGMEPLVRARRAEVLETSGDAATAGRLLEAAAAAPDARPEDLAALAGWHGRAGRTGPALAAYDAAITRFGPALGSSAWNLHYLRALMRDRAGDWPGAEADLKAALALFPDEPSVLNYLGYRLMERGGPLAEARPLLEKAAAQRGGDGGIIDSLGWLQLKAGEIDRAVATLERALGLEPQDATIAGHLGDALWQQGRRIEARFRWRQALASNPEDRERRALEARLDYGLDAAPAMLAQP